MKHSLIIVTLFLALFAISCGNGAKNENNENVGGTAFRKGDLATENVDLGNMAKVEANAPGTNQTKERAFEDAPPLIPHKVDGFVPITLKNNACTGCHMPNVAKAMGATPLPISHFTALRPEIKEENGKYVLYEDGNKVTTKDLGGKLDMARYNCTQCHVVQTNATLDVKNSFKAEYRDSSDKHKSNLIERIGEGVK